MAWAAPAKTGAVNQRDDQPDGGRRECVARVREKASVGHIEHRGNRQCGDNDRGDTQRHDQRKIEFQIMRRAATSALGTPNQPRRARVRRNSRPGSA